MEFQSDVNSPMRTILIDWLIEVADEYKLHDDTLFLAAQYIDRFLSTVNITRAKLQLLGKSMADELTLTIALLFVFIRHFSDVSRSEI